MENGSYQKFISDSQVNVVGRSHDLDAESSKADKKDERRRKAAGGKGGGGTQGRETKTKSTKKHTRGGDKGRHSDSDDDAYSNKKKTNSTIELITVKEIEKAILKPLDAEGLSDLSDLLAQHFYP